MKRIPLILMILLLGAGLRAQVVTIHVDASLNRKPISPSIYGKNNSLSNNSSDPLSTSEWQRLRDAGIQLFRENSGNNATKYNWRLKRTSAPDWYNNVYSSDWDYEAQSLQNNIPAAKAMYAFQLIGKVASTSGYNFNDWAYNGAQWWPGVAQNLAGEGVVDPTWSSTKALVEGNTDLYLTNWPADSTVAILDKWLGSGAGSLNLDPEMFSYWNMDNEPEIWESTHDDVMPSQLSAEDFMQRYFDVAKKARAKFADIKLVGFVPCSEWYWYAYPDGEGGSGKIRYGGEEYTWIEFFIKRIAEEQAATGIRLLDVLDIHTYFTVSSDAELLQSHRIFYDRNYDYPHANGVKLTSPDGWDNSITKEYIFARASDWLNEYLGANHGVTLGSTESGWSGFDQMPLALNYASTLGVFASEGVELFTPWFWSPSYWEVVHLFTRYGKIINVSSVSSDENNLSAYSSISADNDSLTIILVNRNPTTTNTQILLSNFTASNGSYPMHILSNLPDDNSTETFISESVNALVASNVTVAGNVLNVSLAPFSISAIVLSAGTSGGDYLGVTPASINMDSESESDTIVVLSNVGWSAVSDQSWLTVEPAFGAGNGTILVSGTPNRQSEARSATVTVSGIGVADQYVMVNQLAPPHFATEELVIYNDNETLIEAIWSQNGTLSQSTTGAFEGTTHYRFDYSFSNWWAGFGLNLNNWSGDDTGYDFSGYESIDFACSLTGSANVSILFVDADGDTSTAGIHIDGANSTYQQFSLPLSSFTGMDLGDIGEIMVNINGNSSSGSGTFSIDDIRLAITDLPPYNLLVVDTVLTNGLLGCFSAIDTVFAGNVTNLVELQSGASAEFIAGRSIFFLPGFYVNEGAFMRASITTDGTFCAGATLPVIVSVPLKKALEEQSILTSTGFLFRSDMKIYPNPNDGQFYVDLENFGEDVKISVFNMNGRLIYRSSEKGAEEKFIRLSGAKSGVYLLKATSMQGQMVRKVVVM